MPEIANAITQRNFELVRDRIANILAIELPSQATLTGDPDLNATVQTERFVPVKDTELPLVNVMLARGDYNMFTTITQDGTYIFHIDVYTQANYTGNDRADQIAFQKLQRLVGVCQAILSDSKYITLGWPRPSVERLQVNGITFAEPANNKDATTSVMGRLEFQVRISESVEVAELNLIDGYDTTVLIGNTDEGYVFSGNNAPIPPPSCPPADVRNTDDTYTDEYPSGDVSTIPNTLVVVKSGQGDELINESFPSANPSGYQRTLNFLDQNNNSVEVDSVSGNNVTLNTWWNRPTDWLDLPTITNTDNKFAGVYAVFEDGFNTVNIRLSLGNHSIVWGDGATSSGSGSNQDYQHTYDYSTLSGAVNVSDDGRNYKQVIIEADYDDDTSIISFNINTTPTFGSTPRSQGFLDQVFAKNTGGAELTIAWGDTPFIYGYLQRITCLGKTSPRSMKKMSALKVLKNDFTGRDLSITDLELSGDFRGDEVGTPINIINPDVISDVRSLFINSNISKFGDLDLSSETGNNFNIFRFCTNLVEIGNIDFGNSVAINGTLSECYNLKKVGTITVSVNNTTLVVFAENAYQLASLIFAGDLSGVNNTLRALNNCYNLRELLLPNITVGFDISDTQITGQNLQDLFTSLGTASGAQTITLPNFTMGEPTAIATGKGYTIAYA